METWSVLNSNLNENQRSLTELKTKHLQLCYSQVSERYLHRFVLCFDIKINLKYKPQTKSSGSTLRRLCPANHSGWAQLTFTACCKWLSVSHCGSHFNWQSQSKLLVFKSLQKQSKMKVRWQFKYFAVLHAISTSKTTLMYIFPEITRFTVFFYARGCLLYHVIYARNSPWKKIFLLSVLKPYISF